MKKILQKQTGKVLYQTHASTLKRAELINIKLTGAELSGEDLSAAWLDGTILEGAALSGVNLAGTRLKGAVLKDADLSGANLQGADLYGASLRGAVLDGANLREARLDGADLRGARLRGASLRGASFGNRLPNHSDLLLAWQHIQRILCAAPDFLFRRLLPITLPMVAIMTAFLMLRIFVFDIEYDRSRFPASWPEWAPHAIGTAVNVIGITALVLFMRRVLARLGTRKATEGYLGLLFFIVGGVYTLITLSAFVNDVASETVASTAFRGARVLGFAVLVSVVLGIYGVPARMRRFEESDVDPGTLWRAVGILAVLSFVGFALLDLRPMTAPFLGEFAAPEDIAALWRHVQLYGTALLLLLAMWGIMPRLPMPATLGRADLQGADLEGATLRGISLRAANLTGARLQGADVRHADLREAQLEGADLRGTTYDGTTRWPQGFDPQAGGTKRVATPFWHVPITTLLLRRRDF
jgi:uncharacterized protein YjbI with pentapeptide repeats